MGVWNMKRVYVAGPLTTSGSVAENIHNAIRAGNELLRAGYWPHVPHLNYYWEIMFPAPYEMWMTIDLAQVRISDALIRLPGDSRGADREVAEASLYGIPCYNSVREFLQIEMETGDAVHKA